MANKFVEVRSEECDHLLGLGLIKAGRTARDSPWIEYEAVANQKDIKKALQDFRAKMKQAHFLIGAEKFYKMTQLVTSNRLGVAGLSVTDLDAHTTDADKLCVLNCLRIWIGRHDLKLEEDTGALTHS